MEETVMNNCLVCKGVCKNYSKKEILKGVDLVIEPGKIYGLIGRNGVGKTTLLSIMTAQNTLNAGTVEYNGESVWENRKALSDICFSREISQTTIFGPNTMKVKEYLRIASYYYPNWDKEYAAKLVKEFDINVKKAMSKLNKGALSLVTIVVGLASGAPITILDEPVAGLDVVMRDKFYDLIIDDYSRTNRTFIISTHIIEEASKLLEEVIILNNGVVSLKQNTEELIESFKYVSGIEEDVDEAVKGLKVVHTESFGKSKNVCVKLENGHEIKENGSVTVSPVPLQKIFVYLTSEREV